MVCGNRYVAHAPSHLIARLTARSQHLLALRIAEFLQLSPAPVLRHWARSTVLSAKTSHSDVKTTTNLIVDKLKGNSSGVSLLMSQKTAWETGQTELAKRLLESEPRGKKQVPLLLSMKEDDLALVKAIQSSDPDLVYTVLLHLRKTHSLGKFLTFLDGEGKKDAVALIRCYARENDVELLRDFYYGDDRRTESACLALEEAGQITDFGDRMGKIRSAVKFFAEDKERGFEQKMVEEHLKLLAFQHALGKELDGRKEFVGLSVNETIRQLVMGGWKKQTERCRTEFKVPEKRFWYVKMKAMVEVRDWDGLTAWAGKRSPIGFEPFVDYLISTGNHHQALTYIPKCESRNRVELFVKCGEWVKAGEECVERGERARLVDLRARCPNSIVAAELDRLYDQMAY